MQISLYLSLFNARSRYVQFVLLKSCLSRYTSHFQHHCSAKRPVEPKTVNSCHVCLFQWSDSLLWACHYRYFIIQRTITFVQRGGGNVMFYVFILPGSHVCWVFFLYIYILCVSGVGKVWMYAVMDFRWFSCVFYSWWQLSVVCLPVHP